MLVLHEKGVKIDIFEGLKHQNSLLVKLEQKYKHLSFLTEPEVILSSVKVSIWKVGSTPNGCRQSGSSS